MNRNIEKEYKIIVSEQQFNRLLINYPNLKFIKQINTYYDTIDMQIQSMHGMHGAMRIREKNNSYLFTMKSNSEEGLLEFECPVNQNDVSVLQNTEIQNLLHSYGIQGPFTMLTNLTTFRGVVQFDCAELCFDRNLYNGLEDFEIEYEYKKDHDGLSNFEKIIKAADLVYKSNCDSKIKRALDSIK